MNQRFEDDAERTVIIPSPQGRSAPSAPPPTDGAADARVAPAPTGINPLVAAANPLLDLIPQLRGTLQHPDPLALRSALVRDIKAFEARARSAGVEPEKIIAARYALCTVLDEVAASTPWGGSGMWAKQTLLVMFHNEAWGGEKFFQLLSKLAQNPAANRDLLELLYICLSLGFEGRYKVIDGGKAQLESVRERLAQMLRKTRGDYERELAPEWRPAAVQSSRLFSVLPLWVSFAVCAVVLLGVYLTLDYLLNATSDPVFAEIAKIAPKAPPSPPPPKPGPLRGLLEPDIARGLVDVRDETDRSVVTILGDNLFASGSASISRNVEPLLQRVGKALDQVPGNVRVTGHTDNQPIRSARFPSNWHLSRERARTVAEILSRELRVPDRITADGRADADPVDRAAGNRTAADRARNRRVEITLFVAPDKAGLR